MAHSPARAHFTRTRAAQEAAQRVGDQLRPDATVHEAHLAKLHQDRLRLKQLQSGAAKGQLKADLLPEYSDYLRGVIEADAGGDDEVVTTCMVWAIDAGFYADALALGSYVLKHKLAMPDRFTRTVGCVFAEEIADAALQGLAAGGSFSLGTLRDTAALTASEDMPDEVRAKLHLAMGRVILRDLAEGDPLARPKLEEAVQALRRAIELHGACGAKKDLERAERALKSAPEAPAAAAAPAEPASNSKATPPPADPSPAG